ncbi:hypothetical protein EUGRSUZ_F01800 [Eucalyptus grandis]|uniref:Uncharacterized protein n=2 Tax=Eucalyptus grandis TaxID=71139 RepID=A0ACC3KGG5_EUCGR|nr:hypothetical protein EUGRSUZ_F01800 [Eucalyptus grandis]
MNGAPKTAAAAAQPTAKGEELSSGGGGDGSEQRWPGRLSKRQQEVVMVAWGRRRCLTVARTARQLVGLNGKGSSSYKRIDSPVHFDCIYRGITAVSSRESKLLAGNRIIAQPYEFKVGSPPGKERKRGSVDNPNGLFSAQAAPKPPPAMYSITEGMKVGGKRTVIVPPEAGYGQKGMAEIPPGATFELNIELLQAERPEGNQT